MHPATRRDRFWNGFVVSLSLDALFPNRKVKPSIKIGFPNSRGIPEKGDRLLALERARGAGKGAAARLRGLLSA